MNEEKVEFNPKAVLLARLTENELCDLANFDCGDDEMNFFFREEAFAEQEIGMNTTILLYYKGELAAACSICCDAITLSKKEKEEEAIPYAKVPAIKIARLGRNKKFEKLGLGKFLVGYVKQLAYDLLSEGVLGVRFLTVDAYPNKVGYYQDSFGFIMNEPDKKIKEGRPVSMRLDILTPLK